MGEIADMMLDGTLDEQTGEYLGEGPGYPRTRDYNIGSKRERKTKGNVKGMKNFLDKKNLDFETVVTKYWKEVLDNKDTHTNNMCNVIQKDFNLFAQWVNKTYKS